VSLLNDVASFAATAVRIGRGIFPKVAVAQRQPPSTLLELGELEGEMYESDDITAYLDARYGAAT